MHEEQTPTPVEAATNEADPISNRTVAVFDLDGCLSDARHRMHLHVADDHPERHKAITWKEHCEAAWEDGPIWDMLRMMVNCAVGETKVVLLTGRLECTRLMTTQWFEYLGFGPFYEALIMMPDDHEGSYVDWKVSMLDHPEIGGAANVYVAFDDREDVVEAFKAKGVTACLVPHYTGPAEDSPLKGTGLFGEEAANG